MPSWTKIFVIGSILILSLLLCAVVGNFILNPPEPGSYDTLTVGVILFFVVIPILGVVLKFFWKSIPGIASLIALIIRLNRP